MKISKNKVVQFNERHKWCGCIGFVDEVRKDKVMVGIKIPQQGTAYIFCEPSDLEVIGDAVLVPQEEDDEN